MPTKRHEQLRRATTPLPGSVPYDNVRPISVPLDCDGMELLDFMGKIRTYLSRDQWKEVCEQGHLVCNGNRVMPGQTLRSGQRLLHTKPNTIEPDVNAEIEILYEDDALVVVNKPAPLPMHPCGRFNRNTLVPILQQIYEHDRLRVTHRLDADTSGVVVLSKTQDSARQMHIQFRAGTIEKTYVARVHGHPPQEEFLCDQAISGKTDSGGIRLPDENVQPACTQFRVLASNADGTTLLEAKPRTGRTNQIRVHLWSLGLPIVGDTIYLRNQEVGNLTTKSIDDAPLCLHAAAIEITHPSTGERQQFATPQPAWTSAASPYQPDA